MTREKQRGRRWKPVLAVGLIVAVLVVAAFFYFKPDSQPVSTSGDSSHEVSAKGGTFKFHDGIEITVPEGAVDDGTTLSVGKVSQLDETESAPFSGVRSGAVMFDVSLSKDGNDSIQPSEPLDITIPLAGQLLPEGANPSSALLYTANEAGNGFWYVPPPLDDNGVPLLEEGVLHGKLYHLSPKYISYLDEDKFLKQFGLKNGDVVQPEDCHSKVETPAGEVEFGSANDGWSNDDESSPIFACLTADGDGVPHVGIANNANYVLSVASTEGVEIAESRDDFEEELTKLFSELVFPDDRIDAFLGRDGRLDVVTPTDSLPATVQLKADPNTFLAEIGGFAIKFVANIFTGGATSEVVRALLDTPDVISCLQTAFDMSDGEVEGFSLLDAVNLVSSRCTEEIANAVGYKAGFWDFLGRAFNVVAEGISGGLQTIATAFEGIRLQIINTMMVEVVRSAPECLTDEEFEEILRDEITDPRFDVWNASVAVCTDGWILGGSEHGMHDPSTDSQSSQLLFYDNSKGEWIIVYSGQDMDVTGIEVDGKLICDDAPPSIKEWLMCR